MIFIDRNSFIEVLQTNQLVPKILETEDEYANCLTVI
jgi:hypothetical protein